MSIITAPEPKFLQLARLYRDQIQSGTLEAGARLPSYPEFRANGLSQPVVDRALSLLEQEGLINREKGRGVFVRATPRAITGVLGLYGVKDNYSEHPYGVRLVSGVQEEAHRVGYDVLLMQDLHPDRLAKLDGVLSTSPNARTNLARLSPLPAVSLLWSYPEIPSIVPEEFEAQNALARHLLQQGHRRIAYLTVHWSDGQRLAAYRTALQGAGIAASPAWVRSLHSDDGFDSRLGFAGHGHLAMKTWLQEDFLSLGCTALMVHNDDAASGVLRALREAGISVPGDLSVTGFDGTEIAAHAVPPLTTVSVPLHEIGVRGVKTLMALLAGKKVPSLTAVASTLKIAESTRTPTLFREEF